MTDLDLARRAVACPKWKWLPGMLAVTSNGVVGFRVADSAVVPPTCLVGLPDFTDPATLGCLLALVRDAWGDPHASVWYDSPIWHYGARWAWHALDQSRVDYDTEAHALVDALHYASVHRTVRVGE
jgi:hypothetical protein